MTALLSLSSFVALLSLSSFVRLFVRLFRRGGLRGYDSTFVTQFVCSFVCLEEGVSFLVEVDLRHMGWPSFAGALHAALPAHQLLAVSCWGSACCITSAPTVGRLLLGLCMLHYQRTNCTP